MQSHFYSGLLGMGMVISNTVSTVKDAEAKSRLWTVSPIVESSDPGVRISPIVSQNNSKNEKYWGNCIEMFDDYSALSKERNQTLKISLN